MPRYLAQRIAWALFTVWGVATAVFFFSTLIPGDPARVAAGSDATAEQVQEAARRLGLDQPILVQYFRFLGRVLHGDFGESAFTHRSVAADLATAVPVTIQLVVLCMLITALVSVPVGVVAALRYQTATDFSIRTVLVAMGGIPAFVLGLLLQWGLGTTLGWFPISGSLSNQFDIRPVTGFSVIDALLAGDPAAAADAFAHLILPALTLSCYFIATLARNVRSNMLLTLGSDFISFATAKGAGTRRLVFRHCLRAGLSSSLTIFGMQFNWMIGAALLVETVFAMPGLGGYLSSAVLNHDTFAVLGTMLVIGAIAAIVSLIVDLVHMAIDPRVRQSYLSGAR